jgi:hypothetical protein
MPASVGLSHFGASSERRHPERSRLSGVVRDLARSSIGRATSCSARQSSRGGFAQMDRRSPEIRRARWAAVSALTLACVWVPSAVARPQDSTTNPAEKPATTAPAKVPAKTTPLKQSATAAAKSTSTPHTASTGTHSSRKKKSVRARGQQKIDSDRARSIQVALIREHYMSGEPTGTWNQASEDAMRKYQADHGWQSKTVPDSRALIKLGLGPSNDHLLNPESAMISGPDAPRSQSTPPTSHAQPPTSDPAPASKPNQSESSRPQ